MYSTCTYECVCTVHVQCARSDIENCEGWLSPGGHNSGGRALTANVRDPRFNPGWLPVFHSSLKIFPSLSSCTRTVHVVIENIHVHVAHMHVHVHVFMCCMLYGYLCIQWSALSGFTGTCTYIHVGMSPG